MARDRINNASLRQKLEPISGNILRRQNPSELVFKDISSFDAENPIVGSLLRELDVGKKVVASDLVKNAPGPPWQDFAIQNRLDRLKDVEAEPKKGTITTIIFLLPYHHSQFPLVLVRSYHLLHHPLFNPHCQFLIHFNHHHTDLIILLEIFIFQHNFHLKVLVTESKDCLEIYLAHRHKTSPEKKNKKKLFRAVSNKNWTTQFTNYQIHQNLN